MIIDESLRYLGKELIGRVIDVEWEDESSPARVLEIDEKRQKLEKQCQILCKNAAEESMAEHDLGKGKRQKFQKDLSYDFDDSPKKHRNRQVPMAAIKENVLKTIQENHVGNKCNDCKHHEEKVIGLQKRLEETEKKLGRYKRKYSELKQAFEEKENSLQNNDTVTDIGNGVMVDKRALEHKTTFYNSPPILARRIMDLVFTIDELKSSSLTGKQSNANKDKEVKPPLDPVKVTTVIEYTMKQFPHSPKDDMKRKIKVSLVSYLRELQNGKIKPDCSFKEN